MEILPKPLHVGNFNFSDFIIYLVIIYLCQAYQPCELWKLLLPLGRLVKPCQLPGFVKPLLNALIRTDQVVSSMLNVLKGRCKEGAAEILLLIFDESEGCVRDAFRLPEFSSVLADISARGSSKAREKANQLLKKMVEASLDPYIDGNSLFLPWYQ